jgi:hypothetical protein
MQVTIKNIYEHGDKRVRALKDELEEEMKVFGKDHRSRVEMADYFSKVR